MSVPKNHKFKDYTRYAEHCLNMGASTRDRELRCVQREIASEWLTKFSALVPSERKLDDAARLTLAAFRLDQAR
jgi:hypothetical protein